MFSLSRVITSFTDCLLLVEGTLSFTKLSLQTHKLLIPSVYSHFNTLNHVYTDKNAVAEFKLSLQYAKLTELTKL